MADLTQGNRGSILPQHPDKIFRHPGIKGQPPTVEGVEEADLAGMQGESFRSRSGVAILPVSQDRVALLCEVHAYLVFAASEQMNFHQAILPGLLQNPVSCMGELALGGVTG